MDDAGEGFGFDRLAFVERDDDPRIVTVTQKDRVASLLAILFKT